MRSIRSAVLFGALMLCAACACAGDDDKDEDKGDTWIDPATGFTWQVGRSPEELTWDDAVAYCDDLELGGDDLWRLPNIGELRTLIRGCPATETGGSCQLAADCLSEECESLDCDGCWEEEGPAGGCFAPSELDRVCGSFWSTSQLEGYGLMGYVDFGEAMVTFGSTQTPRYARCLLTPW